MNKNLINKNNLKVNKITYKGNSIILYTPLGLFIIKDEMTYILSLLMTNNIILLERKDSNIFTKSINKDNLEDNYIVVNAYAKELLSRYIEEK